MAFANYISAYYANKADRNSGRAAARERRRSRRHARPFVAPLENAQRSGGYPNVRLNPLTGRYEWAR
jgi:hypothetical protein